MFGMTYFLAYLGLFGFLTFFKQKPSESCLGTLKLQPSLFCISQLIYKPVGGAYFKHKPAYSFNIDLSDIFSHTRFSQLHTHIFKSSNIFINFRFNINFLYLKFLNIFVKILFLIFSKFYKNRLYISFNFIIHNSFFK